MRFIHTLFFCIGTGLLLGALSQVKPAPAGQRILLYQEADRDYQQALQLSLTNNNNDAAAERLNQSALKKIIAFLRIPPQQEPAVDSLRFFATIRAGELEHYFDSFPQAVQYYTTAISLKEQLPMLGDSFLFKPYMFAGLIYASLNKFDSAITYLKNAERIQAASPLPLGESERLYNILGSLYFEYGNFKQAKNYYQKAAEQLSATNPSYNELYINYKINLATALFKSEDYDAADSIYQLLLPKGTLFASQIYNNLGLIQLYLGAPKQAIRYFKKAGYSNYLIIGLYADMANAWLRLGRFDSAETYLRQAMGQKNIYNASGVSNDFGRTLKTYGDLEKERTHFTAALGYYQQAIHQFYPSFNDTAIGTNPVQFSGAFSYINLFHTLVAKAEAWHGLYRREHSAKWAEQELETYQAAFRLIEYVERAYDSDEARLFLAKIKHAVHSGPINIAFELYQQTKNDDYLEALYYLDQQNKAAVLSLNRQMNTAVSAVTLPLLQKEQVIKTAITRLSIQASHITDSVGLARINREIRDQEMELGKAQEELSGKAGLKESSIPSIRHLQTSLLDEETALVSYHLSEDRLTTLMITQKKSACYQQALPHNFYAGIDNFLHELKNPAAKTAKQTGKSGIDYYQLLLGRIDLAGIKNLIIIPDDVLNYLPFESLRDTNGKYVIEQLAVQYQYSTSLLKKEREDLTHHTTLSFAPFATKGATDLLPQLPYSGEETLALKGKIYLDTAATKEAFLASSAAYPVIHLATHAVVNPIADNLSYIAFWPTTGHRDNLLYAQEIYNLSLQHTRLIILSACETSAGDLIKGEGVMSLSRAFTYAGCPNTITSLWKADDFSTSYLTVRIHQYLDKEFSITKAVRQAKLDYLNDKKINPRLKHPYYWSHLIFIGDYKANNSFPWLPFLVAGLPALLLLFLLLRKPRGAGR